MDNIVRCSGRISEIERGEALQTPHERPAPASTTTASAICDATSVCRIFRTDALASLNECRAKWRRRSKRNATNTAHAEENHRERRDERSR